MIEQLLPKNVASSYQDGGLSLADLKTDIVVRSSGSPDSPVRANPRWRLSITSP